MHLKNSKIAMVGMFLAICVLCVYGGTILESNTLILLSIASVTAGIVMKDYGLRMGAAYVIASVALSFILVPMKMYSVTLAAMELYLFLKHSLQGRMGRAFLFVRYIIFNVFFISALIFVPSLIYTGTIHLTIMVVVWGVGQIVFTVYDICYDRVLVIWEKFKKDAKM